MTLDNAKVFGLSLELGLVISVWSPTYDCEMMRGYPSGADKVREPDLRVTPDLDETDANTGRAHVVALTDDGRAFLDLVG